ncbi:MAG: alpha-L-fucosidase [Phycisphaerae bacterium]
MSDTRWFEEARYGMFIHWGPYSALGHGEWAMNRERIPMDEYTERCVKNFRAEEYDPRRWAKLAREAGMKYVVLTTKHHDGFCLWDTRTTDYNSVNYGPKRDLLVPYVEALREEGLKVGFYLSAASWTHPDYPEAFARDWPVEDDWESEEARKRFVAHYHQQVEELMSNYGRIDVLWWDGCIPQPLDGETCNRRAKELQPHILINERNGEPYDFRCSEQSITAKEGLWESCMTLNDNWGYHLGDDHWKDAKDVVRTLVNVGGQGGNLLLNVGPRADGTIQPEACNILRQVGRWLERNGQWLPESGRQPFTWNNCLSPTVKGSTVYLHMFARPGDEVCWADLSNKVLSAKYLDTGEPVDFEQAGERLFLRDLREDFDPIDTVVALEVEGTPQPITEQKTFWIPD